MIYFSFQPVLHDWCNKGCGMYYPVCVNEIGLIYVHIGKLVLLRLLLSFFFFFFFGGWGGGGLHKIFGSRTLLNGKAPHRASDQSYLVDPFSYLLFQPVLCNWYNNGHGMCYPACGMLYIKISCC